MMNKDSNLNYLVASNYGKNYFYYADQNLNKFTERHKHLIKRNSKIFNAPDLIGQIQKENLTGVILQLECGLPCRLYLNITKKLLADDFRVFYYWPREEMLELINHERLKNYRQLWFFDKAYKIYAKIRAQKFLKIFRPRTIKAISHRFFSTTSYHTKKIIYRIIQIPLLKKTYEKLKSKFLVSETRFYAQQFQKILSKCSTALSNAKPIECSQENPLNMGNGLYLRLDFWVKMTAGGSYGHTCYVAKEFNKLCSNFITASAHTFSLLDTIGVQQIALKGPETQTEFDIVMANAFYEPIFHTLFQMYRPTFIYERLVLGNYVGAILSQHYNIPYIVEYNGSEITMKKSFDDSSYIYEDFYLKTEETVFSQATAISVISETIAENLIERGVPKEKILVNPNGADPERYKPVDDAQKALLKENLGWSPTDIVIGFIGTFGGWHGIDVLSDILPTICNEKPNAKFLLIGDGCYKHLIESQLEKYDLHQQVLLTGLVPQDEAISLLQACDIYLSPHSSHMQNCRFFGSPTKLFEYMSLAGGIVASDLVQIGEVLNPALHSETLGKQPIEIGDERAILTPPGNRDEFAQAIIYLIEHPDLIKKLGINARKAVLECYNWKSHLERLIAFVNKKSPDSYLVDDVVTLPFWQNIIDKQVSEENSSETQPSIGYYKQEVQKQWDNSPCGGQFVKYSKQYTRDWYIEVEEYRYQHYARWMPDLMEFDKYRDKKILEIGAGIGTDLVQFAKHGAITTDLDLSAGHLKHAKTNFEVRGLKGEFKHGDAENIPFPDNSFDLVYSNGVIHHSPNTQQIINEIYRVLKPGGKAIIMVYARNSLHYWNKLVLDGWLKKGLAQNYSIAEIMSRTAELSTTDAKPLVKVYTPKSLRNLFNHFDLEGIEQRQMLQEELPKILRYIIPISLAERKAGWNLIVKARKPVSVAVPETSGA